MATLAGIHKQIADLQKQAEAIRKTEAAAAAAQARDLIAKHQLTADDLGLGLGKKAGKRVGKLAGTPATSSRRKPALAKTAGVPKYRDPKSDKTWTGTGKPPGWIADAKNRSKFLIDAEAAPAAMPAPAANKLAAAIPKAPKAPKTPKTPKATRAPKAPKLPKSSATKSSAKLDAKASVKSIAKPAAVEPVAAAPAG